MKLKNICIGITIMLFATLSNATITYNYDSDNKTMEIIGSGKNSQQETLTRDLDDAENGVSIKNVNAISYDGDAVGPNGGGLVIENSRIELAAWLWIDQFASLSLDENSELIMYNRTNTAIEDFPKYFALDMQGNVEYILQNNSSGYYDGLYVTGSRTSSSFGTDITKNEYNIMGEIGGISKMIVNQTSSGTNTTDYPNRGDIGYFNDDVFAVLDLQNAIVSTSNLTVSGTVILEAMNQNAATDAKTGEKITKKFYGYNNEIGNADAKITGEIELNIGTADPTAQFSATGVYGKTITNGDLSGTIVINATDSNIKSTGIESLNEISNTKIGNVFINGNSENNEIIGIKAKSMEGVSIENINIKDNSTSSDTSKSRGSAVYLDGNADIELNGEIRVANYINGITANGDINLTSNEKMVLIETGEAKVNGRTNAAAISTSGNLNINMEMLAIEGDINALNINVNDTNIIFNPERNTIIRGNIMGDSATKVAQNLYGLWNPLSEKLLIGTYTPQDGVATIYGTIEGNKDFSSVNNKVQGTFVNDEDTNKVGWIVTKNTYLTDTYAKTEKQRAITTMLDSAKSVDNGGKQDKATANQKIAAIQMLSSLDMSTVAKMAYEEVQLAESVYADSFFKAGRISDTWKQYDELPSKFNSMLPAQQKFNYQVGVNSINRFGTAGGEGMTDNYDYNTYGGMATFDGQYGSLIFGAAAGGWTSKVNDGALGKADATIIGANLYCDWNFFDSFDWFTTIYYGNSSNTLKRNDASGEITTDWNGNAIGGMTALRYSIRVNEKWTIKPFAGMMLTYNMKNSVDENSGTFSFGVKSKDYSNVKGVAGVEGTWNPIKTLYISGRVIYAYEFADNAYDMTVTMNGWGTGSYTGYETSRSSIIGGIGINYDLTSNWNVGISYNAEVRSSELNNNVNASVGYKF